MAETSGSGPEPGESLLAAAVVDGLRVCLRCDWTGETGSGICPRCEAPLYRPPEAANPRSHVDVPQEDDNVPRVVPVVVSRRTWAIAGALTIAALWIVANGAMFDRQRTPTEPAAANAAGDRATTGGVLRHGNEVLLLDSPDLVAVDPDTGERRTLLDLGAGLRLPLSGVS
jgi:hypothetical protein